MYCELFFLGFDDSLSPPAIHDSYYYFSYLCVCFFFSSFFFLCVCGQFDLANVATNFGSAFETTFDLLAGELFVLSSSCQRGTTIIYRRVTELWAFSAFCLKTYAYSGHATNIIHVFDVRQVRGIGNTNGHGNGREME